MSGSSRWNERCMRNWRAERRPLQQLMLRLTQPQIEQFHDAGYVVLPGVFSEAEIREIGEAFDRLRETGDQADEAADDQRQLLRRG